MAKTGRPKSDNVKKKVLSIRMEDSMYKCICDYANKHKMTMTEVARDLEITVGTLTTAINRLIKKEYVERRRIEEDRRVVLIKLTEKGDEAFKSHADFHDDMIKSIMKELPKDEEEILITALKKMVNFFEEKYNLKK